MTNLHTQLMTTDDVLEMLRQVAQKLLLAYDETYEPDFLDAFEKTAEVCELLFQRQKPVIQTMIH